MARGRMHQTQWLLPTTFWLAFWPGVLACTIASSLLPTGGGGGGGGRPPTGGKGGQMNGTPPPPPEDAPAPARAPLITISSLQPGEEIDVFHRYAQDPNGYFMVNHSSSGIMHPSVGKTDGWTRARVSEAWNINHYRPHDFKTWVEIQWTHPVWYNRRGHRLDVNTPSMVTQRVLPEQIRQRHQPSEAQLQPSLTLFHVRWGGEQPVNPVTEGAGGWGQIGSTPSDNYINGFEESVFQALGPTYEIISAFYQNSEELTKLQGPLLRNIFKGKHVGALYFCWPISFQDGHEYPAYVQRERIFELMVNLEASGIPTRFPHHSHLYRIFASKEWTAQMCLHPLMRVPLTTMVARQAVACNPAKAAETAIKALGHLAEARNSFGFSLHGQDPPSPARPQKGVAKLGWSWEAMDVQAWHNKQDLATTLTHLVEQPGSLVDHIFVQEWVDFDVEMRHFIVEADLNNPESWKPKRIIYTVFKSREQGCFRNFDRYDRKGCLKSCFQDDQAALDDAEQQAQELIHRWLQWLQAQTHELPVVMRFDIMARRTGPGRAAVATGELTELGGCFLGWPKGPQVVFAAMLRSCFRDPTPAISF
uniref:WW domain-containing protein n=1 Tax=Alexandrium catenella TaxID=2925 RepID=A0A7S1L1W8_ALECA|mmetsp:Transcript_104832/g.278904  ORF Transcript_104832/g.278904 Transcript_104832/m.278904 type:complete len:590 (+) Transcript_104832:144-1913(+)